MGQQGQVRGENGALVKVRREQRAEVELWRVVELLDDGLGNAHAVVRRRPTSDLVEDHQTAHRCQTEDAGSFRHLHHER